MMICTWTMQSKMDCNWKMISIALWWCNKLIIRSSLLIFKNNNLKTTRHCLQPRLAIWMVSVSYLNNRAMSVINKNEYWMHNKSCWILFPGASFTLAEFSSLIIKTHFFYKYSILYYTLFWRVFVIHFNGDRDRTRGRNPDIRSSDKCMPISRGCRMRSLYTSLLSFEH